MSARSSFISLNDDVPLGYATPGFPSLYWPLKSDNDAYNLAFLFYKTDVWRFTLIWSLILYGGMYFVAGVVAAIGHRRLAGSLMILSVYTLVGGINAIVVGTVVGFVVGMGYEAASLQMSTWIPFVLGLIQLFYVLLSSYSITAFLL